MTLDLLTWFPLISPDGMIIIECYEPVTLKHSGQLVLDAMTDAVVHFKSDRFGRPYLSPDSRKLVTVSHGPDGTTLLLQLVKGQSNLLRLIKLPAESSKTHLLLPFLQKMVLSFSLMWRPRWTWVTFPFSHHNVPIRMTCTQVQWTRRTFCSWTWNLASVQHFTLLYNHNNWILVIVAVISFDFVTGIGKVEMVSGVGGALEWSPWKSSRPISSQGLFSLYLATPSADAVFVLNGLTHTVNCQIGGLSQPHQIVWL